ncbi:MAG: NusG domain II-containing protein [Treponema sp.]|nr:NusG domain II-containing protein [Treponema sp.]
MKFTIFTFFRKADFVIFFLSLAVTTASFLFLKTHSSARKQLLVTSGNREYIYFLEKNRELEINGAIGKSVIEIQDGRAFFKDSPCTNKTCVHMGSVSEENDWAACLPNDIFIRVD